MHGYPRSVDAREIFVRDRAIQGDSEMREILDMRAKQRGQSEHVTKHVTRAGRSALIDVALNEDALELKGRSTLLRDLERWLESSDLTQTEAAKLLAIPQACVSDLKRGKISQFRLDMLIRLAARAGLARQVQSHVPSPSSSREGPT